MNTQAVIHEYILRCALWVHLALWVLPTTKAVTEHLCIFMRDNIFMRDKRAVIHEHSGLEPYKDCSARDTGSVAGARGKRSGIERMQNTWHGQASLHLAVSIQTQHPSSSTGCSKPWTITLLVQHMQWYEWGKEQGVDKVPIL
ncbi:hypothetical protein V8C86DRAFT_758535 [Haematococcus lacustris]